MASYRVEMFPDELDAVMDSLLYIEDRMNIKEPKLESGPDGKMHLYVETVDHKQRTKMLKMQRNI